MELFVSPAVSGLVPMMRGRPKADLVLTEAERQQLQAWTRRRKTARKRPDKYILPPSWRRPDDGTGSGERGVAA